jgi:hypothetical protein
MLINVKNYKSYVLVFLGVFYFNLVMAEIIAKVTPENQASFSDDGLGVEFRTDKDGKLLSVKSTYQHPVEFPDRRGIAKAYKIAEEKAKGNIARFMEQSVKTSTLITELDESQSQSNRSRSNTGATWNKDNSRKVTESLLELNGSNASAVLRGVRVIERTYSAENEEVTVVVGINKESQQGAQQLQNGLGTGETNNGSSSNNQKEYPSVKDEKRRSTDFNKF